MPPTFIFLIEYIYKITLFLFYFTFNNNCVCFFSSRKTGFSRRLSIILPNYDHRLYVCISIFRAVWERIIAQIIYHISHSDPLLRQNFVLTFHIFNFSKVGIVITFLHLIFDAYILYLLKSWQLKLRRNMVSISHIFS